ncbi:MAG TPA: SDR family oxidoreductase [Jatrophihabitans sp.]|nr:SDR family oxidoreductase [Jatrophihabitans sp.]
MSVAAVTGLLAGRRALITGGANGIGAAVAARFAKLGADGVVVDLPNAACTAPDGWQTLPADVRDEQSIADAVRTAAEAMGGVDAVVAAAGVVPNWQRPEQLDLLDFERVLAINVLGVAATVKHVAPLLDEGSTITAVGSLNSWRGDPNITSYVASKHAVLGVVRSAALALGSQGVRVNAVAPGPIATQALRARMRARRPVTGLSDDEAIAAAGSSTALGRIATVHEVVDVITFLTSHMSSGMTGQLLAVDCGIN